MTRNLPLARPRSAECPCSRAQTPGARWIAANALQDYSAISSKLRVAPVRSPRSQIAKTLTVKPALVRLGFESAQNGASLADGDPVLEKYRNRASCED